MTEKMKIEQIEREIGQMFERGEIQELLKSDLDSDTLKFIAMLKDFYIQKQQKQIIAKTTFEI